MDSKTRSVGTRKVRRESVYEVLILVILVIALSVITKPFIGRFESNIPVSLRGFPEGRIPSSDDLTNIIRDKEGKDVENVEFDSRGLPKSYDVKVYGITIHKDQGTGYNDLIYNLLLIANALLRLIVLFGGIKLFTGTSLNEIGRDLGLRKVEPKHIIAALVIVVPDFSQMLYTFIANDEKSWGVEIATIVFLFIGPGIFEEAFFRGFIFNRLSRGGMNWFLAALLTSVASAFVHLTNLFLGKEFPVVRNQIIFSTLLTFMLCYFFVKTGGNIWGLVTAHALIDFSVVLSGVGVETLQFSVARNTLYFYTHWGVVVIWGYLVILAFFGRAKKPVDPNQVVIKV
jgi:membrane protease YdiL (CAAX protease family)